METAFRHGFHRFEWMHRKANGEDFPSRCRSRPSSPVERSPALRLAQHYRTETNAAGRRIRTAARLDLRLPARRHFRRRPGGQDHRLEPRPRGDDRRACRANTWEGRSSLCRAVLRPHPAIIGRSHSPGDGTNDSRHESIVRQGTKLIGKRFSPKLRNGDGAPPLGGRARLCATAAAAWSGPLNRCATSPSSSGRKSGRHCRCDNWTA